jgi:hypothetical protein
VSNSILTIENIQESVAEATCSGSLEIFNHYSDGAKSAYRPLPTVFELSSNLYHSISHFQKGNPITVSIRLSIQSVPERHLERGKKTGKVLVAHT